MTKRQSHAGKKYGGRHSSFIEGASLLARFLERSEAVDKISAGIIKTKLINLKGKRRIKVIDEGACVLIRVRDNISMQEIRVYTKEKEQVYQLLKTYTSKQNILLQ